MTEASRENVKKQIAAIEAFIKSEAHSSYVTTIQEDIDSRRADIESRPPINEEERAAVLILHGELNILRPNLTFFKDALDTLNKRLQVLDAENPVQTK